MSNTPSWFSGLQGGAMSSTSNPPASIRASFHIFRGTLETHHAISAADAGAVERARRSRVVTSTRHGCHRITIGPTGGGAMHAVLLEKRSGLSGDQSTGHGPCKHRSRRIQRVTGFSHNQS